MIAPISRHSTIEPGYAGSSMSTNTSSGSPSPPMASGMNPKSKGKTIPCGSSFFTRKRLSSGSHAYLIRLPRGVSMTTRSVLPRVTRLRERLLDFGMRGSVHWALNAQSPHHRRNGGQPAHHFGFHPPGVPLVADEAHARSVVRHPHTARLAGHRVAELRYFAPRSGADSDKRRHVYICAADFCGQVAFRVTLTHQEFLL